MSTGGLGPAAPPNWEKKWNAINIKTRKAKQRKHTPTVAPEPKRLMTEYTASEKKQLHPSVKRKNKKKRERNRRRKRRKR